MSTNHVHNSLFCTHLTTYHDFHVHKPCPQLAFLHTSNEISRFSCPHTMSTTRFFAHVYRNIKIFAWVSFILEHVGQVCLSELHSRTRVPSLPECASFSNTCAETLSEVHDDICYRALKFCPYLKSLRFRNSLTRNAIRGTQRYMVSRLWLRQSGEKSSSAKKMRGSRVHRVLNFSQLRKNVKIIVFYKKHKHFLIFGRQKSKGPPFEISLEIKKIHVHNSECASFLNTCAKFVSSTRFFARV